MNNTVIQLMYIAVHIIKKFRVRKLDQLYPGPKKRGEKIWLLHKKKYSNFFY